MKQLMSGNEAIARGAWEAGVRFATGYPGTPSTEVLEALARYEEVDAHWSTNEKAAFEEGMGAALGGIRTMVTMKHVGLNVAADPFMVFPYAGTNAAFVVLVADDPGMYSSQNEQDSRLLAKLAKVPILEPADSAEALALTKEAFELSERFETPVMLRTTTRLAHTRGMVQPGVRREAEQKRFSREASRYAIPPYARFRRVVLEDRLRRLKEFAETYEWNQVDDGGEAIGVVSHGIPWQYVKEVLPQAAVFKLAMPYPLPEKRLKDFCSRFETVFVVEESEGFIQQEMASFGILNVIGKERFTNIGELSADLVAAGLLGTPVPADYGAEIAIPPRPPVLCSGCPHFGPFQALKELGVLGAGDIGCYTLGALPPFEALHTVFCMGASIGNATGFIKAGEREVVAVIGDSTFLHGGLPSLVSAVYNKVPTTTLLLDNSTTGMTGQQEHPGTGKTLAGEAAPAVNYEELLRAVGVAHVSVVDPWDLDATKNALRAALDYPGPAVVIARRPCLLLPEEKRRERVPYQVDAAECTVCGQCMELGCAALVWEEGHPHIREWACAGCSLCAQVCSTDAVQPVGEN